MLERIPDKEILRLLVAYCKKPPKEQDAVDLVIVGAQTQLEADKAQIPAIERAAMERERELIWSQLQAISGIALDDKDFVRRIKDLQKTLIPKALKSELLGKGDGGVKR